MPMARNVHDALFGMSHLPGKSGWWGELLSMRSEAEAVEPASLSAIQTINNSFMTFSPATEASSRGFAFILGLVFGCASLSMILSRVVLGGILSRADFWPYLAAAYGVVLLIGGAFFVWSIAAVRRTAPPPVVLSRRLRKFYCWIDKKIGWVTVDYDAAHPVSLVSRSYSLAGAATGYVLAVIDIDSSDRRIRSCVPLAQPNRDNRAPEMIWEFIRHYMDGDPKTLPPVDPLPSIDDAAADYVLLDRRLYGGLVDNQHRIKPGAFPVIYVSVVGAIMYWFERAGLWIWRRAPRPDWPSDILADMSVRSPESSFRTRGLTAAERLAYDGNLDYLNRRWLLLGSISTVLVFMMFAVIGIPPWFSDFSR